MNEQQVKAEIEAINRDLNGPPIEPERIAFLIQEFLWIAAMAARRDPDWASK